MVFTTEKSPITGLVLRGEPGNAPRGAVLLTRDDAQHKQWDLINSWKPWTEVWAAKTGHFIISAAVGFSCIIITSYYRRKLKLGTFGQLTTHIPTVFIPSCLSGLAQLKFVTFPILVQDQCPICIQLRSSALHAFFSVGLPCILAPLASFGYAYSVSSVKLPEVKTKNAGEYLKIYWKMTSKYKSTLGVLLAGNALLASFITYKTGTNFYDMHMTMLKERAEMEKVVYGKVSDSISKHIAENEQNIVVNKSPTET